MTRDDVIELMHVAIQHHQCAGERDADCVSNPNCLCRQDAIAALSALEAAGIAIVPIEPTEEMLKTSLGISHATKLPSFESRLDLRPSIWKHMLAASPLRPQEPSNG